MDKPPSDASPLLVAAAGLVALAVAMGVGRFAFTPILPMMQDDAGLSVAVGAWLASANYLGYFVGALSAIALPARPAPVIRASLLAIALTTFAMELTENFTVWLVLRALAGVASAWVLVFVSAWSIEQLAQRSGWNGVVFAGVGAGIFVAGAIALVLMQAHTGDEFQAQAITLTDSGQDVLASRADWIAMNGIDKWRGGVHLAPDELWRWDADARTLVRPDP